MDSSIARSVADGKWRCIALCQVVTSERERVACKYQGRHLASSWTADWCLCKHRHQASKGPPLDKKNGARRNATSSCKVRFRRFSVKSHWCSRLKRNRYFWSQKYLKMLFPAVPSEIDNSDCINQSPAEQQEAEAALISIPANLLACWLMTHIPELNSCSLRTLVPHVFFKFFFTFCLCC